MWVWILLVLVLLLIWYTRSEGFAPCSDCDQRGVPENGLTVLNPMQWPYSAYGNPDDVYRTVKNGGAAQMTAPLTNAFTPDHVVLTN